MALGTDAGETVIALDSVGACVTMGADTEAGARVDAADSVGACVARGMVTATPAMESAGSASGNKVRRTVHNDSGGCSCTRTGAAVCTGIGTDAGDILYAEDRDGATTAIGDETDAGVLVTPPSESVGAGLVMGTVTGAGDIDAVVTSAVQVIESSTAVRLVDPVMATSISTLAPLLATSPALNVPWTSCPVLDVMDVGPV